jgi:hypothetical protein
VIKVDRMICEEEKSDGIFFGPKRSPFEFTSEVNMTFPLAQVLHVLHPNSCLHGRQGKKASQKKDMQAQ